jgi:histidinol-phosphatase
VVNDWRVWRDAALSFADLADQVTSAGFRRHGDVATKSDGSWVTAVDVNTEQVLRQAIMREFPQHTVLGEEDGTTLGDDDAPVWIIDPIDGTANFVAGNPIFATLIAVQVAGEEVASVISAPALSTRFDALRGEGSRQDGRAITVSQTRSLADAEVSFGGLTYFVRAGQQPLVDTLVRTCRRTRGYGDFWQHCLVAAGSTDVAIDAEAKLWDMAAVKLLVEAAGGRFTGLNGTASADTGSGVSTNGILHADVLAFVS